MIVIDTSAIFAILGGEPEGRDFSNRIVAEQPDVCISAGNVIEAYRVSMAKGSRRSGQEIDGIVNQLGIEVIAVDAAQVALAREGMERFGKGRAAPPAVLNFGDLFAYALARSLSAPLLFKGDDFAQTDLEPAWRG